MDFLFGKILILCYNKNRLFTELFMFIDQEWKKQDSENKEAKSYPKVRPEEEHKIPYIKIASYLAVGLFVLLALGISFIIYTKPKPNLDLSGSESQDGTSSIPSLPISLDPDIENGNGHGTSTENLKAEEVAFGDYYIPSGQEFVPSSASYQLPMNIKSDVLNYYDTSRKIDLDNYIAELNENGFAVIDNQFSKEANDFFDMYRYLIADELPIVITSDFLFYYYQNELKQVFKEIEKNAFYENIWQINKSLYDIALTRYKRRLSDYGPVNDPVLEGMRLETAYLSVALKLLMPDEDQINFDINFTDENKFNVQEANDFTFDMPESLVTDVTQEAELIRAAKVERKSPILLFDHNYSAYKVPDDYVANAKLNNFYLAINWLSTVFPLNYLDEDCEQCLLDYNDWMINMAAAGFLAKDLSQNQDLKNQWAIIYKFMSFFKGLRQDLTYLNYNSVYEELFGPDYSIEEIYANENSERDKDLKKIQDKISAFKFSDIEGTYDRGNLDNKPILGMRLLQEPYWPNNYLFNQLTGTDMILGPADKLRPVTACDQKGGESYRCLAFGLDIVNLLDPIVSGNEYFKKNTDYTKYPEKINFLRRQFGTFDKYTWNNNVYWKTLDISKKLFTQDSNVWPTYMRSDNWQEKKIYNTVLGGWVNLHLAADQIENYYESDIQKGFGGVIGCNELNYIEPYVGFIEELIAKNYMLQETLKVLGVSEKTNAAAIELKELNSDLEKVLAISKKELSNEKLDDDDCKFMSDMAKHYNVHEYGNREFLITMENSSKNKLTESIKGVKLLLLVYNKDGQNIMAVGPVFNYQELR